MDTKEYIVILKEYTDLDDFYTDMEQQGRHDYVPDRPVEMVYRRPTSRSTHYLLTDEEVAVLRQDPRVLDIVEPYYNRGIEILPLAPQFSNNWSKSPSKSVDLNWGLLRGYQGSAIAGWGRDGTANASGTINLTNVGNNVDVVIIDGHIVRDHPEFAVNADGTGGTRYRYHNWLGATGIYQHDATEINHGTAVAGIACGNTCGWARGANIYNICPYSSVNSLGHSNWGYDVFEYIKAFHAGKAINPVTGRKNPTVCNMSYATFRSPSPQIYADPGGITGFYYKGVNYSRPAGGWTDAQIANYGINVRFPMGTFNCGVRDSSIDNDIVDAISAGIIFVGAAANEGMYVDVPSGPMYQNAFKVQNAEGVNIATFYMQGCSPTAATGVINVGSIDFTVLEQKAAYSNAGPRTDIFAAGTFVMSACAPNSGYPDPRNNAFFKGNQLGTSFAAPQVTGIIACALETYPNMTAAQALTYVQTYANSGVLADPTINTDFSANELIRVNSLLNAANLYITYHPERGDQHQVYPKRDYSYRPTSGLVFPRLRARKFG
jgi:hypothetical protein